MAIRILSSENITGNLTLHSSSNAPYIDFVENADTSDSKARITMDQIDTNNGTLLFATENAGTLTNAIIIDSSQNVGIGTTSPSNKLDVKISTANRTTLEPVMSVSAEGSGPYTGFGPKISFSSNIYYGAATGNPAGIIETAYVGAVMGTTYATNSDLVFATRDGATSVTEKMRILGNGNVGIGTNDPDGKVHIFKNSNGGTTLGTASDELVLENDTDCGLTIRSGADSTGVVSFASPTDHNVGQLYYNHDDDSMVIRTNDAIRTIIGSSGIMYIMGATASTNNSLQLQYNSTAGTAEIYSKSTGGNTTFEFYTSNSGTTTQKFNIGSSGDVKITTNGKFLQGVRNTSGTVIDMIGFGAGTDRLQIKGGTSGGAESIAFFDTAGQMATFYNSNFGIGTTSPSAKLEIKATGASTGLTFRTTDSSNNETFYINDGGTVGVRYYPFKIGVASGTTNVANSRFQIATTGGDFVVLNDGKTGIGTTSPAEKLEVNGNIKAGDTTGKFFTNVYTVTTASFADTFSSSGAGLWEYTIRINPNPAGSGAYVDFYYGKVGVGTGWNGSNVTDYIWYQEDQTAPRSLYPSGGGNKTISWVMVSGGSEVTNVSSGATVTIRVKGFGGNSYNQNISIYLRRLA